LIYILKFAGLLLKNGAFVITVGQIDAEASAAVGLESYGIIAEPGRDGKEPRSLDE
jgi:hypothetical protein